MGKTLLIFRQSPTIDVYVNVLTHCIHHENVTDIYFIDDLVPKEKEYEAMEFMKKIYERINELAKHYQEYATVLSLFPRPLQFQEKIIRIPFSSPDKGIKKIKEKFPDTLNVIVDISTCKKRLASDVITSFMVYGITHVCHFELSDKVYSPDWKTKKGSLIHELKEDSIAYYNYDDFSKDGTTVSSFNKLRKQGKVINLLLFVNIVLGLIIMGLIGFEQTYVAIIFTAIGILTMSLGFIEDSYNFYNRTFKE